LAVLIVAGEKPTAMGQAPGTSEANESDASEAAPGTRKEEEEVKKSPNPAWPVLSTAGKPDANGGECPSLPSQPKFLPFHYVACHPDPRFTFHHVATSAPSPSACKLRHCWRKPVGTREMRADRFLCYALLEEQGCHQMCALLEVD
jgi:hypothetical protein